MKIFQAKFFRTELWQRDKWLIVGALVALAVFFVLLVLVAYSGGRGKKNNGEQVAVPAPEMTEDARRAVEVEEDGV